MVVIIPFWTFLIIGVIFYLIGKDTDHEHVDYGDDYPDYGDDYLD